MWRVVVAGRHPPDLGAICEAAYADSVHTLESIGPESAEGSGIVVVGDDAALATAADRIAPATGPLALVPSATSDLLRMFGLTRAQMLARLGSGAPYRVDLGRVDVAGARHPFVTHVVAAGVGPWWLARRASVMIDAPRREHHLLAWQVVVANSQHLEGRTIAPRAAVVDGLLDVQALGGTRLQRPTLRRSTRRGLHLGRRTVWRRSLGEAILQVPPAWSVWADGVRIGSGPFRVDVRAGAFDLWI